MLFIEKSGIDIASRFLGYNRQEMKNLQQYFTGVQNCLLINVQKMFVEVIVYRTY